MPLTPSNAHLWVPCSLAGNVLLSGEHNAAPQQSEDDDARREGICAHWAGELLLRDEVDHPRELIGLQHNNGWVIDQEMAHHAAGYRDYCRKHGDRVLTVERPVSLFSGMVQGRADVTGDPSVDTVQIFDFKYGWRPVEADQNWSLLCYGLALAEGTDCAIEMHLYQPRPQHPDGIARVWRIEPGEVPRWRAFLYAAAVAAYYQPSATVGPYCRRCPFATGCHANAGAAYHAAAGVTETRMIDHTPEALAMELRFLDWAENVVVTRRKAVVAEAEARIASGHHIPGYALEARRGNRAFTVSAEMVELITGRSATKPTPKSPAELEREGVPKHVIGMISERPFIGRKLTSNPEVIADKIFGKAK